MFKPRGIFATGRKLVKVDRRAVGNAATFRCDEPALTITPEENQTLEMRRSHDNIGRVKRATDGRQFTCVAKQCSLHRGRKLLDIV